MSKSSSSTSGKRGKRGSSLTFTFEKLAKSKVILDITTLAFFIEFSARDDPTIKVYDVLKKSKSFNAFYNVLNRITQGLNETKFSYFFLAMVLHFSTDKSYSFKEFDLMFPNLGFSENEEQIGKMLHNISKQVITELSESNSPKKRTSSRLSSLRKNKISNRFSIKPQNGGNYKNRFKRRTMKYKQTGGDLWMAFFILCMNAGVGLALRRRAGPGLMMLLYTLQIVFGGMAIHTSLTSLFNFGRNGDQIQNEVMPAMHRMATDYAARFQNSFDQVPNAVAVFNESPPMQQFREALGNLPDQFARYRRSQSNQNEGGFYLVDIIALLRGDVNIVIGDVTRLGNLLDGFLQSNSYRQLHRLVEDGANAVGEAVRAAAANSRPLYDVPEATEGDGYLSTLWTTITGFLPRIGNAQREIDALRYNAAHAREIYDAAVRALGDQGLLTATRMAENIQILVRNACTAYHTQVSFNINALANGLWQFLMGIFGFTACVTFMRQNDDDDDNDNRRIEN